MTISRFWWRHRWSYQLVDYRDRISAIMSLISLSISISSSLHCTSSSDSVLVINNSSSPIVAQPRDSDKLSLSKGSVWCFARNKNWKNRLEWEARRVSDPDLNRLQNLEMKVLNCSERFHWLLSQPLDPLWWRRFERWYCWWWYIVAKMNLK